MQKERTLIIIKPDGLQRNLLGEIIGRFDLKGLKIIGMKMMSLHDEILEEHYCHHKDKPFFEDLKNFMKSSPIVVMVLEGGKGAVEGVRLIVGATKGISADAGTIRGDLAFTNKNLLHASDTPENAEKEIYRFFNEDELFEYTKLDEAMIYENNSE